MSIDLFKGNEDNQPYTNDSIKENQWSIILLSNIILLSHDFSIFKRLVSFVYRHKVKTHSRGTYFLFVASYVSTHKINSVYVVYLIERVIDSRPDVFVIHGFNLHLTTDDCLHSLSLLSLTLSLSLVLNDC